MIDDPFRRALPRVTTPLIRAYQRPVFWAWALLGAASLASAQPSMRPADERPPAPEPEGIEPGPELELPPLPEPSEAERGPFAAGLLVRVERYDVQGSTVFTEAELALVTAPFRGREIGSEELLAARDAITALYASRGYLSSGAVVPDQAVENGVVRIEVIEGRLGEIEIQGTRWFQERYFRQRLARAGRAPVDAFRIEAELQRFQRSPYVERVDARLEPGARRGESRLVLRVEERSPDELRLAATNHQSPSIGSTGGDFAASLANLIGIADELRFRADLTEGLRDYDVAYDLPLERFDTRLGFRFRDSRGDVVEKPFDELGVFSESRSYALTLDHPFFDRADFELWAGATGEYKRSEAFLSGSSFCAIANAIDCEPEIAALRLHAQPTWRGQSAAASLRSTFAIGLDALGATQNPGRRVPDGQFEAWLGQLQLAWRLPERWPLPERWRPLERAFGRSLLLARLDLQFTRDPLLSIEKISIGGSSSVRGYRENEVVRDSGVVAGLELRIPLARDAFGRPLAELAPFADLGHGWDSDATLQLRRRTLASLGSGLRLSPVPWLQAELYYGYQLASAERDGDDLQDHGIHFSVSVDAAAFGRARRSERGTTLLQGPR